jgi:carbamoyltransferase
MDGVGEWATTSVWLGQGKQLTPLWQIDFPHSAGLLYSAFTYYLGFRVNSGEYKLMGLAPYGQPIYVDLIKDHLIDIKPDGSFRLDMAYFNFATGLTMTNQKFHALFGQEPRKPDSEPDQKCMDIAASIQAVIEEIVLRIAQTVQQETGMTNLCMAGGVALNCVANGRLLREGSFDQIWIQPAAGDAGGAIGAALAIWHDYLDQDRQVGSSDSLYGGYLGPQFSATQIGQKLTELGAVFEQLDEQTLIPKIADLIKQGAVVGWFQGRMEFGARALGNRSILADPGNAENQSRINLKIKYRESFRPFAPAVLAEQVGDYFAIDRSCPYMQFTCQLADAITLPLTDAERNLPGLEQLQVKRSTLPAITHVNNSARLQTVSPETNPVFHHLLETYGAMTGYAVLVNTSFNVRGEPIVCTPEDAWRCFMHTGMDYLVIGDFFLDKDQQPARVDADLQPPTLRKD